MGPLVLGTDFESLRSHFKGTFMNRLLSVLILTAVTFAKVAADGVELRESTITSESEKVPAGTTVTVNVVLKNTGDKSADGTDVRIRLPLAGFLVRIDELPALKRDDEEREVSARLDIPAGEDFRFSFDLLASRTKVGQELASHIEVVYLWDQIRWNSEFSKRITNAPSTAGVVIGGLRFHPASRLVAGMDGLLRVDVRVDSCSFAAGLGTFRRHCDHTADKS